MTSDKWEIIFKVMSALGVPAIMGLFVWVWTTNLALERLKVELLVAQKEISEMESNATDIQLIKQDIRYIKGDLSEIKQLLTKD